MRIGFVVLLALTLGLFTGAAATVAEFGYPGEVPPKLDISAVPLTAKGPLPALVAKETSIDFGEVEKTALPKHVFIVGNDGPGVLELFQGSGCGCTASKVSVGGQEVTVTSTQPARVPPGEYAEITLAWHPAGLSPGTHSKPFTIPTNDPTKRSLVLTVHGTVIENWRFEPTNNLSFHDMSTKETRQQSVNLLVYRGEKLEIRGHKWGSQKGSDHIGLDWKELTPAELAELAKPVQPAHPGAPLEKKPLAKSGYKLTFTARPGMPIGHLGETITLDTNLKSPAPVSLNVHGQITGDITLVVHPRVRPNPDVLSLGTVVRGKPQQADLMLRLVGEHRKNVKFTVKKVVPEELQVTFGKPAPGYDDRSMLTPMRVVLPANAKSQAWLSTKPAEMGQILLETTHPEIKEFKILVQVAVVEPDSSRASN